MFSNPRNYGNGSLHFPFFVIRIPYIFRLSVQAQFFALAIYVAVSHSRLTVRVHADTNRSCVRCVMESSVRAGQQLVDSHIIDHVLRRRDENVQCRWR